MGTLKEKRKHQLPYDYYVAEGYLMVYDDKNTKNNTKIYIIIYIQRTNNEIKKNLIILFQLQSFIIFIMGC